MIGGIDAATSVAVAGGRVTRYVYQGKTQRFDTQEVSESQIVFGSPRRFSITLTKTELNSATASYRGLHINPTASGHYQGLGTTAATLTRK